MYVNEYVSTMHECICMQLSSYLYLYLYLYPSSLSLYRLSLYIYIVIYVRWNSLLIKTIQGLAQGDVQMHRRSTKNTEGYASSQVRGVSLHPSRISAVTNQLIVPSRCESQGNGLVSDFLTNSVGNWIMYISVAGNLGQRTDRYGRGCQPCYLMLFRRNYRGC